MPFFLHLHDPLCTVILCIFLCPLRAVARMIGDILNPMGGAPHGTPQRATTRSQTSSAVNTPDSQRSPRRMPSRSPASASHVRRADSADVETVGSPTGSAMEAEADSEFGSAARKRARHVLYTAGTDRVDSLNTIFQLQWYIIAQVGMQIQLGKTNHRDANHRLMMDAYKQQVPGVARGFWKYMTHDRGGRRGNSWCNGHDLPWLEKRLMHKNGNFEPKNAVGGQYLWNQWTGPSGLRSQIQEEAWPAWQFVTANGENQRAGTQAP